MGITVCVESETADLTDFVGDVKLMSGEACACAVLAKGLAGMGGRLGEGDDEDDGVPVITNESRSSKTLLGFGDAGAELEAAVSASSLEKVREVRGEWCDAGFWYEEVAAAASSNALTRLRIDMTV